jgi:hypothetical protein
MLVKCSTFELHSQPNNMWSELAFWELCITYCLFAFLLMEPNGLCYAHGPKLWAKLIATPFGRHISGLRSL